MATQMTYSENIRPAIEGARATMVPATLISRNVETAAGIGFGKAVYQGTDAKGVTVTPNTKFVGITIIDRSAGGIGTTGTGFKQYESARILTKGDVWVIAQVAVAAGDPVYLTAGGLFTNVATDNTAIPGARWDTATTGATQLAVVRI
jgi:hypothetical protein